MSHRQQGILRAQSRHSLLPVPVASIESSLWSDGKSHHFINAGLLGRNGLQGWGVGWGGSSPFAERLAASVELKTDAPSLPSAHSQNAIIIINIINKKRGKLLNVKYATFLSELAGQFINAMA